MVGKGPVVCYCEVVITNLIPRKELFRPKINYFGPSLPNGFGVRMVTEETIEELEHMLEERRKELEQEDSK